MLEHIDVRVKKICASRGSVVRRMVDSSDVAVVLMANVDVE
jgi:hypothetical protein